MFSFTPLFEYYFSGINMKNIFVYGSLMNDEVFSCLIRGKFKRCFATLYGYKRTKIVGKNYPAIRRSFHCKVNGILIMGLSYRHLIVLDRFEGSLYKRISVSVYTSQGKKRSCDTYFFKENYQHLLKVDEWCNDYFRDNHMVSFIKKYRPQY